MMQTIQVLDQATIDKIAAGEVVERPASVVKELVENALDAKATAITVEIQDGGIRMVRITDNGFGIPAGQVRTAFLRHATSKLRSVEELTGIHSLGFRGEALSSIAAVAQVELITKTPEVLQGIRYQIEGGREVAFEEIGAPSGTTFIVRNLFYNTPARKKFLRSAMTEAGAVGTVVEQLALSHPEVSFKYMVNRQTKLHTSGNRNLRELVYNIFGRDIAKELVEIRSESELLKISGFIGKPVISRGNRNFENYYVNNRYVKSKLLAKAIEDGYHTSMMQHKYPFTLLYLELDGEAVDVNVHPTKMELRFSRQEEIYEQLTHAITQTLKGKEQIVQVSLDKEQASKEKRTAGNGAQPDIPEPFERERLRQESRTPVVAEETSFFHAATQRQIKASPSASGSAYKKMPIYPADAAPAGTWRNAQVFAESKAYLTEEEQKLFTAKEEALPAKEEEKSVPKAQEKPTETEKPTAKTEPLESLEEGREQKTFQEQGDTGKTERAEEAAQTRSRKIQEAAGDTGRGTQLSLFDDPLLSKQARSQHRMIGQVFDTFWLIQYKDSLYIIDQHAAHEKVLYERMMKNFREQKILSQMVSPPLVVTLTAREAELLQKYQELFRSFGYEAEPFGGKEYAVSAVPHELYGIASQTLFVEILDHLEEIGEKPLELITEKLASMSCKAAVKGNNSLSVQEMEQLVDELLLLEDPYHCPHGRPTIIEISRQEMEKKFKRIV